MRIVVCVKDVPDTTDVRIDPETNSLVRDGVPSIVNPFDAFALELALSLKDRSPDIEIIALCMGPEQAKKSLRETIGMGADSAVLASDTAFAGSDTWATSYTLAAAIRHIGDVDMVFCGQQAIDGDTAQVGPGIAQFLGWPQGIFVRAIDGLSPDKIVVERLTEGGHDVVELGIPAVISVVKLPRDPRLPSLRGMMKAKRAEIPVLTSDDIELDARFIGLSGSPTRVRRVFTPPPRGEGQKWEGEPEELASRLVEALKKRRII